MASKPIQIVANGEVVTLVDGCSLGAFIERSGLKPTQVVAELNGDVVPRDQCYQRQLVDGDQVEIVIPVAGG